MNREILFRGKRLDNGEWVTGHLIADDRDGKEFIVCSIGYHWEEDNGSTNRCMECFGFEIDPKTVGQYTGLTIKGEKLFEHDQIRFRETEIDDWEYGTVVWQGKRDYPAFDVEPWIDCDCNGLSYIKADCEVEIVGNKWDNPELLGVRGMNREIKFRAYQPEAKGDLKWWSWQELRESDLNTIFRHPERYHLMQYTGLKDKNGVEIYEGDICRAAVYKDPVALRKSMMINSLVVFRNGAFTLDGYKRLPDGFRTFPTFDDCEVIGNIHDNPELLEVD